MASRAGRTERGNAIRLMPTAVVDCPHCGEEVSVEADPAGGRRQELIEDCWVCCRPIRFTVTVDREGRAQAEARPA